MLTSIKREGPSAYLYHYNAEFYQRNPMIFVFFKVIDKVQAMTIDAIYLHVLKTERENQKFLISQKYKYINTEITCYHKETSICYRAKAGTHL